MFCCHFLAPPTSPTVQIEGTTSTTITIGWKKDVKEKSAAPGRSHVDFYFCFKRRIDERFIKTEQLHYLSYYTNRVSQ